MKNSKRKKNARKKMVAKRRWPTFQPRFESLEMRALLSITTATGLPIAPVEGTAFTGEVATFTSPDSGPFTADIDWGDGTTTSVSSGSGISGAASPFTITGTHTYADEGTDTVKVTITDTNSSDPGTGSATSTATVAEADTLTVTGTPVSTTATQDSTFTGTLATFATSNTNNVAGDFTATIEWGDGSSSTG
ncbi:MAG TPA: hypothetical protein VJ783_01940, partial [Pirellulales bacterium]|nr:hypothetical protein [Pirellulales bacterium]